MTGRAVGIAVEAWGETLMPRIEEAGIQMAGDGHVHRLHRQTSG
jgi:hypothetical protein